MTIIVGLFLIWFFGRIVYASLKGFLIGLQLGGMHKRGIDCTQHPIFDDAKWGKHFAGVKTKLEANRPKVTVFYADEPKSLAEQFDDIQQGWS